MDKLNLPNYQREFMEKGLQMTLNFLQQTLKGQNKVIEIKSPQKLQQQIDFKFQQQPCGNDQLVSLLNKILNKQTKPYHPHFHNQLFGGFDQYSVLGAMIAPTINGSVYTYELAPCFTLMEQEVYDLCKKLLHWKNIDGIFTPGGSFANFMSITTSRYNLDPSYKSKGNNGKPLKIFTSETSHYSMKKGAHFCGIGEENVIYVKADMSGRMIPEELDKCILKQKEEGNICMLVNATMGTTVQGNIDPIKQIGKVCKQHDVWFHVDAALGGALLFSPKLMQGKQDQFADVDSITIDPHKGLLVPLQLSLFLINKKQILFPANSAHADYLFHKQRASYSGNLDVGDKSFQCGRVIDILKFWTYLKGNGLTGIAQQVENQHKLALYVKDYVKSRPQRFILVVQDVETFNVCFWYVPQHLKEEDFLTKDEFHSRLSQITVLAKKYMIEQGKMLVGYSKSQVKYYFWRTVMSNPFLKEKDVDYEMELTVKYCQKAYEQILENERHLYQN